MPHPARPSPSPAAAPRPINRLLLAATLLLLPGLAACSGSNVRGVADDEYQDYRTKGGERGRLFGEQGLALGVGKGAGSSRPEEGGALGVNAYLWRGALDTLAFMPLASADPFGGVIITDWYQPSAANAERFKATAYILGQQLRADGVKVAIFRQVMADGQWTDAPVAPAMVNEIENKVLARARELRSQSASN